MASSTKEDTDDEIFKRVFLSDEDEQPQTLPHGKSTKKVPSKKKRKLKRTRKLSRVEVDSVLERMKARTGEESFIRDVLDETTRHLSSDTPDLTTANRLFFAFVENGKIQPLALMISRTVLQLYSKSRDRRSPYVSFYLAFRESLRPVTAVQVSASEQNDKHYVLWKRLIDVLPWQGSEITATVRSLFFSSLISAIYNILIRDIIEMKETDCDNQVEDAAQINVPNSLSAEEQQFQRSRFSFDERSSMYKIIGAALFSLKKKYLKKCNQGTDLQKQETHGQCLDILKELIDSKEKLPPEMKEFDEVGHGGALIIPNRELVTLFGIEFLRTFKESCNIQRMRQLGADMTKMARTEICDYNKVLPERFAEVVGQVTNQAAFNIVYKGLSSKLFNSLCKEFLTSQNILWTMMDGKSVDADHMLRDGLKVYACKRKEN